jgi:1-acyl-sn-glycerol-3-phosphate acyltransferase
MLYRFMRGIVRLFMRAISRIELLGSENIPGGNVIVVANHLGRLDTAVLFCIIDREDIIMPIAEKYRHHPLYSLMGRAVDGIWLNRFDTDYTALREILARLERGGMLTMAPEGTRSQTEALQEGKPGVAFLAAKSGYPIVAVGVTGTEDRLIKWNLRHLRRSRIRVNIGKPFQIAVLKGRGRGQAMGEATDEIMCRIAVLLPEKYWGVYAGHPRLTELLEQSTH